MKVVVANVPEQNEDSSEQAQDVKVEAEAAEKQNDRITLNARPLNMMANNFVHADGANDDDNYSLMSLQGMKSDQSLMTKYNSAVMGIMSDRVDYVEDLMADGASYTDAKYAAAAIYGKRGEEQHKKLGEDLDGEELKKQAEESKEYNEERTEEVVEEKQKAKAAEDKKSEEKAEAKVAEEIADNSDQSTPPVDGVDAEVDKSASAASSESGKPSTDTAVSQPTDEGSEVKGSGTGDNVDKFV